MRNLLLLVMLATVATLGYMYAPQLIDENYRPSDGPQPTSGSGLPEEGVAQAAPAPMQASAREITRQAPEPRAAAKTSRSSERAPKQKKSKAHRASSDGSAMNDDQMDQVSSDDVERVTGLKVDLSPPKVAAAEPVQKQVRRQEAPKSRWIEDLSGQRVRIEMGKKSNEDACAAAYANCERPNAPKDISVAGVVVKTQKLVADPTTSLDGQVRQGNYVDGTPAVYVK